MGRSHPHTSHCDPSQKSESGAPGIIMGFDIGSTSSSVSFALLVHDRPPEIQAVNSFTDQSSPSNRIPSVMYYDRHGNLMAAGPSAATETAMSDSEIENWVQVERFIMHLRPYDLETDPDDPRPAILPPSKTAIEVMGDFLRYLYNETIQFIKQHYVDGEEMWKQVMHQRHFVFSLPNGWVNVSQHRMHQAAISGGLINVIYDRAHISFVNQSDASTFACLLDGQIPGGIPPFNRFILVDGGEDNLQVMSYELDQAKPARLKEMVSPRHSFNGSLSINARMRGVLKRKLRGSSYDNQEILDEIVKDSFEPSVKWKFSDARHAYWLRVGGRTENNADLGIQRGLLRLTGDELAECFEEPIRDGLELIRHQMNSCGGSQMAVWIVGTLARSQWFIGRLREDLSSDGISIIHPDIDLSSAVADGCVASLLYEMDCEREPRRASGIVCSY